MGLYDKTPRKRKCGGCKVRTLHDAKFGKWKGKGTDRHRKEAWTCQECKHVSNIELWPDLLSNIFGI